MKKHIVKLRNEEAQRDFNIYLEEEFGEYLVANENDVTLFRAESEQLARYGVRTFHHRDYCGMLLTENGVIVKPNKQNGRNKPKSLRKY